MLDVPRRGGSLHQHVRYFSKHRVVTISQHRSLPVLSKGKEGMPQRSPQGRRTHVCFEVFKTPRPK